MAVASASASSGIKAPASTFAELLRRSRFASYDSSISQTYTAPPAYARRGNYGLKRAIPMPYKDSYISLPTFEHHAHFAEWNNAEAQVKFVQRVEEMGVFPRPLPSGTWDKGLGEAKTQWIMDSEFAEENYSGLKAQRRVSAPLPAPPTPTTPTTGGTFDAYGKQGPGGYGSKRPPPKSSPFSPSSTTSPFEFVDGNHLQLNIESLSPKQFQRYLSKIRQLAPEFKTYLFEQQSSRIESQLRASARAQNLPEPTREEIQDKIEKDDLLLFIASQNSSQKLHRRFLGQYFAKGYKDNNNGSAVALGNDNNTITSTSSDDINAPVKIEAQPHQNGGLTYSHFSDLDSLLTTQPLPGLVLQSEPKNSRGFYAGDMTSIRDGQKQNPSYYIALFGGLTAKLLTKNAGVKIPLYKPDEVNDVDVDGVDTNTTGSPVTSTTPESLEKSSGLFRMTRITLRTPPKVVGYAAHKKRPSQLLDQGGSGSSGGAMSLDTECTTELPWSQRNLVNPYRPGSFEYSAHQQVTVHNRMGVGRYTVGNVGGEGAAAAAADSSFTRLKQKERDNKLKRKLKGSSSSSSSGYGGGSVGGGVDQEFRRSTSKMLSGIVGSAGKRE